MRYKKIYFAISGIVIAIGLFSLLRFGFRLGLDFVGGAIAEYKISKEVNLTDLEGKIKEKGIEVQSVSQTNSGSYLFRLPPVPTEKKDEIAAVLKEIDPDSQELRFEIVGASFGPELIKKTIYALSIAAGVILIWVAIQFKSLKFGASAVLAMLHDSLVLIGVFALLGKLFGAEIDFLFVTAMLTTLSFSVHDTIVVYDRIREKQKKEGRDDLYNIANSAVSETMVRSLNNSFTIIFMLVALTLLGGVTIRWFAIALLIGTVSGTYSSPFVAVPLLVTWDEFVKKIRKE
ncbi:protein translocase subunit SecF [Candidatus Woesebacteria bacterium]|nr:protein translocase subunit SecF [Candidatus Woesebacteria bacterium]